MADKFNRLLEAAGETDKVELKILHNASVACLKAYNEEPTAVKKRDLDAARAGLNEAVGRLWPQYFPAEERFKNLLEVAKYLKGRGYKVGKSKLYKDRGAGRIRCRADGGVLKKDVDTYAKGLKHLGDPLEGLEAAQQRKAELEAERLEAQTELYRLDLEQRRGRLIERAEADLRASSHLSVMESAVRNMIQEAAAELCEILGGNGREAGRVAAHLNGRLDEALAALARTDELEVVFGGEDEKRA